MNGNLPDPAKLSRASDMELYALALYLYSLSPPPNPNQSSSLTRRGALVFHREGCSSCHTPPIYTNNMLIPVDGFRIPAGDRQKHRILDIVIGTDPALATKTRRATGYYKKPSLRCVWYRGPFEHNGSVATLEEWFDPRRLRDDYIPTGYRGYGNASRAIRGHEFDLKLDHEEDRAARRPLTSATTWRYQKPGESERVFQALSEGGQVEMPIQETFWAVRFGMVVDRFGIPWMINCEKARIELENMVNCQAAAH